jgi:hypothetical protein
VSAVVRDARARGGGRAIRLPVSAFETDRIVAGVRRPVWLLGPGDVPIAARTV